MSSTFIKKLFFIFLPFFFLGFILPNKSNGILTVFIKGMDTPSGSIRVAIYNSPDLFLEKNSYVFTQNKPVGNNKSLRFDFNMPYGSYAVSCYHDINDSHTLDKNYMGIPVEPYALSNNVNVKWRRPTFDETKITFSVPAQTIYLEVKRWKDR